MERSAQGTGPGAFPGYVFVHLDLKDRLRVLQVPSVVRFVSFNGHPAPLPDAEIEVLVNGLARGFAPNRIRI